MKHIDFYETSSGWMYVVWLGDRATVVGCATTRARAEQEAALA